MSAKGKSNKTIDKFEEKGSVLIRYANMSAKIVAGVTRPFVIPLFDMLEHGRVAQRAALWAGIYLSIWCIRWAFDFAETSPRTGTEVAAIIAAILAPISMLTGALMKFGETIYEVEATRNPSRTPTAEEQTMVDKNNG